MNKKPTKQELIDHVESLVAKCAELTRERDYMRRIWCEDTFKVGKSYRYDADGNPVLCKSPQEIAEGFEWDCFNENTDYLQDLG